MRQLGSIFAFAAIVAGVIIRWRSSLHKDPQGGLPRSPQNSSTMRQRSPSAKSTRKKGPSLAQKVDPLRLIGATLGFLSLVGSIVVSILLYNQFVNESATPPPPKSPGTALIAFDRSAVPAIVQLDISPSPPTQLHFNLTIPDYYQSSDEVGFVLNLSGPISLPSDLGSYSSSRDNGCPYSVFVIPDLGTKCTIASTPTSGYIGVAADGQRHLVIQGTILRNSANKMFTQVDVDPIYLRFDTSAGKRTYFILPEIGTTYFPTPLGSAPKTPYGVAVPLDYGAGKNVYPPYPLSVAVNYRELRPSERADIVTPATYVPGNLLWIEGENARLQPRGSLVDAEKEDESQSRLFLIGVAAGLLGTAFPLISSLTWKSMRSIRKQERQLSANE